MQPTQSLATADPQSSLALQLQISVIQSSLFYLIPLWRSLGWK